MTYLLDTHTALWYLNDDAQLPPNAKARIENAQHDIIFSMVSLWEIEIKASLGKLRLRTSLDAIYAALIEQGMRELSISIAHLARLRELPFHHRDPFDRLLIAQAMTEDAELIRGGRNFTQYPVRIVWYKQ